MVFNNNILLVKSLSIKILSIALESFMFYYPRL